MNILLIWPPSPEYHILTEEFSCCEPLGLEYVAASLEDSHRVDIVDLRLDENLTEYLEACNYDMVGISIPYTVCVNSCNNIIKHIRMVNPYIKIVIGGHYPTVTLDHILIDLVDYVVFGEGIPTFRNLVDAIELGSGMMSVEGTAYVSEGRIHRNSLCELTEIDSFPLPARHLLSRHKEAYFHAHYNPVSLARFSTGCPYNCSFCILWKLTKRRYISRQNELIINELSKLENENVYVVDDEAFIQTQRMKELAQLLIRNGIRKKYHMYVRSDTVVKNPGLMESWALAGLDSVLIGMESLSENQLRKFNKSITVDNAYGAVKILHRNHVEVRANFIVTPDYSIEDFQRLKDVISTLDIDKPTFSVITPFIGTDEYSENYSNFVIDKLEFFDCFHTFYQTYLPINVFYREFAGLFRYSSNRDTKDNSKIFYAGSGSAAFSDMLRKMEDSYKYYAD